MPRVPAVIAALLVGAVSASASASAPAPASASAQASARASTSPVAVDPYPRQRGIDALHYAFHLVLSDQSDSLIGELQLDLRVLAADVRVVRLDLVAASSVPGGRGMVVDTVLLDGAPARYAHTGEALEIALGGGAVVPRRTRVTVRYRGLPASGLVIGPNRYGDRTFFSDNWPDRARHWLPTIDHVADKATSEFLVIAPSHYQVVSNGRRTEVTDLPGDLRLTHWTNGVPISPWLFVLGVARFAVQQVDTFEGKAIETWVYPQDREAGFDDFATPTKDVLAFYSDYVGPFAYERLANIQSNSVSGGMEAASAILYNEAAVTGTRSERWRNVVIHEIAHQWFGNAVTEATWDDVWLSEGFATYFTLLFIEHAYGRDEFLRGLEDSRQRVLAFHQANPRYTVLHDSLRRMADVTTSQTYQKGSWVLHMLRGVVGPAAFRAGIRAYYRAHLNGVATTADFRRAMEEASGMELGWFFRQWLTTPGALQLAGTWRYDARTRQVQVRLEQVQTDGSTFRMPIEIGVRIKGQTALRITRVEVRERVQTFMLDVPGAPEAVVLDPNRWVLFEGGLTPPRS